MQPLEAGSALEAGHEERGSGVSQDTEPGLSARAQGRGGGASQDTEPGLSVRAQGRGGGASQDAMPGLSAIGHVKEILQNGFALLLRRNPENDHVRPRRPRF